MTNKIKKQGYTMTNKPTETATFDKELFLWTDGVTKLNPKRKLYKTGVWKYYDLSGTLVTTRKYNKNGKKIAEQFFPPKGIDTNAVMMSFDDIFEAMYWIKEAPTNTDGEKHGIYKEWYRKYNDEVLTKHDLKRKTEEQLIEIWEKSAWWLREVHYKNGESVLTKIYDDKGNEVVCETVMIKKSITKKPTETATFDKDLYLWTDGKLKNGKPFGVWSYYDLSGNLILQSTFNQQGKEFRVKTYPPHGIDENATILDIEGINSWIVIPPEDKDIYYQGTYKKWFRENNGKPLSINDFKNKNLEQVLQIWEKSAWCLKELHYEDGALIWTKNYNKDGELELFEEYKSDSTSTDEQLDNEQPIVKKSQKSTKINHKTPRINYTKTFIHAQDLADKIQPLSAEQRLKVNALFVKKYSQNPNYGYDCIGEESRFAYGDWHIYDGDLLIEDNFFSNVPLVITGNLTVKGNYLDGAVGGVIVCGDMQVEGNVLSEYPLLVIGNMTAKGLICLHYNDYGCEFLGDIECDILHISDRAREIAGEINAQLYCESDDEDIDENMAYLQQCLKEDVFEEEDDDYEKYVWIDTGILERLLLNGESIYKD